MVEIPHGPIDTMLPESLGLLYIGSCEIRCSICIFMYTYIYTHTHTHTHDVCCLTWPLLKGRGFGRQRPDRAAVRPRPSQVRFQSSQVPWDTLRIPIKAHINTRIYILVRRPKTRGCQFFVGSLFLCGLLGPCSRAPQQDKNEP